MKKIILFLLSILILSSCVKYSGKRTLNLSGTYVINQVVTSDTIYYIGDTINDTSDIILPSLDTTYSYVLGDTLFQIDYSIIRFNPIQNGMVWEKEYYYYVVGQFTVNDLGYMKLSCEGLIRVWEILEDGVGSLRIRIQPNGYDEYMVLNLTRIGP
jgi:hypothetical protein